MSLRSLGLLAATCAVATACFGVSGHSSATYSATTANPSSVSSAPDWTPPTVSVRSPGDVVSGAVVLVADAEDDAGESGIARVTIQYRAPGSATWVDVCTTTAAPYTCSWDSSDLEDGAYALRSIAVDDAGNTGTSDPVPTTVANTVTVVLDDPGEALRGDVPLSARVHNGGSLDAAVRIEFVTSGQGGWSTVPGCSGLPLTDATCVADTDSVTATFDLRAVVYSGNTVHAVSAEVTGVIVDNTRPWVSLGPVPDPLRGTDELTASAGDVGAGIDTVVFQYAAAGSSAFADLCSTGAEPYTCSVETTGLADGSYDFRAVATDLAGNDRTSGRVTSSVQNAVASVTMVDPGGHLARTVSLSATTNLTSGVDEVTIQRAVSGSGSWVDVCSRSSAPYTCSWNTSSVPDGLYDIRAVLTYGAGSTVVSELVAARRVDNAPLRGLDIQARNGSGTAGRLDAGDQLVFTYSREVEPGSLLDGWDGSERTVTVALADGELIGRSRREDSVGVYTSRYLNNAVEVGSVNLENDYIRDDRYVTFGSSMTHTVTVVGGIPRSVVTVTLGSVSGSGLNTVSTASSMAWSPAEAATAIIGGACSAATVREAGPDDRDF